MASDQQLANVLQLLVKAKGEGTGKGRIHIIAHSLGNRVLMRALSRLNAIPRNTFGNIVLIAADIDYKDAIALFAGADKKAKSLTLYFCAADKALEISRLVHSDSRVRQSGLLELTGIDNIDATKANTSFIGHDYFVSRCELLIDLQMLLRGKAPGARETLRPETTPVPPHVYWAFP